MKLAIVMKVIGRTGSRGQVRPVAAVVLHAGRLPTRHCESCRVCSVLQNTSGTAAPWLCRAALSALGVCAMP